METFPTMKRLLPLPFLALAVSALTAAEPGGTPEQAAKRASLAASVALAGSHGARIRRSLAAKADSLRAHQVAETESAAESATERMAIPVAVVKARSKFWLHLKVSWRHRQVTR